MQNFFIFSDEEEVDVDKLQSILAQLEFQYSVESWEEEFHFSHLHISEVHPMTNILFCEREDEGHVVKIDCTCVHVHV